MLSGSVFPPSNCALPHFSLFSPAWNGLLFIPIPLSLLSVQLLWLTPSLSPCSHCDACKLIGGGCEYTMNTIANKSDVHVTKGSLKNYTYRGDSGMLHFPLSSFLHLLDAFSSFLVSSRMGMCKKTYPVIPFFFFYFFLLLLQLNTTPPQPILRNSTNCLFHPPMLGEARTRTGKDVICNFCPTCTSHAYHHQTSMGPDKVIIRTAFLDGNKEWKVSVELYGKDRAAWQPAIAHTFDVVPPS